MLQSSPWFLSYTTKLLFFARIRRLLQKKASGKCCGASDRFDKFRIEEVEMEKEDEKKEETKTAGMEERKTKETASPFMLQRSVKQLHFGSWEEKEIAVKEIRRLAGEDLRMRKSLAALGVIPSLVSMLGSEASDRRRLAVQALIELANGTYTNKALMVEAGIFSKLPKCDVIDALDELEKRDFAVLMLSISVLANTQLHIASSEILLPFIIRILVSDASMEAKEACLGTIYNLSTMLESIGPLVSSGVVHTLLVLSSEKETSEKALAALGNMVVPVVGKKAMENEPMVPGTFIEILTWEDKPKCQELAAYILMILAHQSSAQREKMSQLRIVPVLLEVALLGSSLAQKRALKLLQWFKDERQSKIGAHSGPQTGRVIVGSPVSQRVTNEGKRMMKNMVRQSLNKNMELITRRANAAGESSNLKALVISSSSKSLPY
ncbi:PREDICTED: U-box domain-containing protein 7 [Nelumbo nucifera]|nr:PREDICTED: U-box domain-containing protein 7 [Nelumbo nucifera]